MKDTQERYAIGIDLGGTNLRGALVSRDGNIVKKIKEPVTEEVLDSLSGVVESLFSEQVAGIGLGVAGLIDRKEGRILISPNLPVLNGANLVERIGSRFGVPVTLENDANAAAVGEKMVGAGREFSSFVLFTLGTGIGGAIVHNDKLLNVAAEIGHMTVQADGQRCHCGNFGCLEAYASGRAVISRVIAALEKGRESLLRGVSETIYKLTTEDIYRTALDGDSLCREALRDAGRYLGIGIANMINLMSPGAIILMGGLTGAWDIYVKEAIKEASKRALRELFDAVKIIPSSLGDNAGIIGAAGLVFEHGVIVE